MAVLIALGLALASTVGVAWIAPKVALLIRPLSEGDCPDCWHGLPIPNLGCKHPEYHEALT